VFPGAYFFYFHFYISLVAGKHLCTTELHYQYFCDIENKRSSDRKAMQQERISIGGGANAKGTANIKDW